VVLGTSVFSKGTLAFTAGLDGIPNEFLKFGGDIMITSLTNLFITISDIEQTPSDWLYRLM
jgi:hypothetical protein